MPNKFIQVHFVKQDCGPLDSFIFLNTDHIRSFTWSQEDCEGVHCYKWCVYYYEADAEADIFWIRLREFDFLLTKLLLQEHRDGEPHPF